MQISLNLLGIIGLLYIMYQSAHFLVSSASSIAKHFKVSDLVIGLTIVAIGTSAPELVVSVSASLQGSGDIAVSNIVGSNIYNLGIILGVVAFFSHIKISKKILFRDVLTLLGFSILQFFFFLDSFGGRGEGIILLLFFFVWFFFVFRSTDENEVEDEIPEHLDPKHIWKQWGIFGVSLLFLVFSGHFMVDLASQTARIIGISEWIIGLTIVGIGTSTPELITSLVAIKRGSHGISIGNLFGSDIFNQAFILGVASVISPIITKGNDASSGFLFIAFYILFLFVLLWWRKKISKTEGIIIIVVVSLRFAWEIWKGM